jgi:hypothetical protein
MMRSTLAFVMVALAGCATASHLAPSAEPADGMALLARMHDRWAAARTRELHSNSLRVGRVEWFECAAALEHLTHADTISSCAPTRARRPRGRRLVHDRYGLRTPAQSTAMLAEGGSWAERRATPVPTRRRPRLLRTDVVGSQGMFD